ncbi:unnamed protein product [Linum trigynum]|uniref:Retrovirus-related Pol polyprotein from transposon TNT 1-94-like beta-barrel domain-containing protein n=1 Tax=Linum trigynum TaxID=586398 RepID=A0AAV2GNY1_9ROSI
MSPRVSFIDSDPSLGLASPSLRGPDAGLLGPIPLNYGPNNMSPNKNCFSTCEQLDCGNMFMASEAVCKVVGIRSIKIRTHNGSFCTLNEVRHVPQMTKNLISLSLLDSKGLSFKGRGGVVYVCKAIRKVLKGVKRENG